MTTIRVRQCAFPGCTRMIRVDSILCIEHQKLLPGRDQAAIASRRERYNEVMEEAYQLWKQVREILAYGLDVPSDDIELEDM